MKSSETAQKREPVRKGKVRYEFPVCFLDADLVPGVFANTGTDLVWTCVLSLAMDDEVRTNRVIMGRVAAERRIDRPLTMGSTIPSMTVEKL